ncbi:MAG TPA: hypothetical protein VF595_10990 [Tepidisphaeraceae bacterium]|jgi:hypothetical protein
MKVNKSQKIWLSLLGLGLGALGLDNMLGGETTTAITAEVNASAERMTPADKLSGEARISDAVTAVFNGKLARRLDALAKSNPMPPAVRDAFAPPHVAAVAVAETPRVVWTDRAPKFKASHELQAIVETAHSGQAMVDGRLLAIGQSLDGFKLESVGRLRAVFSDGVTRAELVLKGTTLSGAESHASIRLSD